MINNRQQRKKAWIGAAISAVAGIAGGIANSIMSNNAEKKKQREQQIATNKQDIYNAANNLSAGYGDQEYIDDFKNKVVMRRGGKLKSADRLMIDRRFACGGRLKKANGGNSAWNDGEGIGMMNSLANTFGNVASTAIRTSQDTSTIHKDPASYQSVAKTEIKQPDYNANGIATINPFDTSFMMNRKQLFNDRLQQARFGIRKKCNK